MATDGFRVPFVFRFIVGSEFHGGAPATDKWFTRFKAKTGVYVRTKRFESGSWPGRFLRGIGKLVATAAFLAVAAFWGPVAQAQTPTVIKDSAGKTVILSFQLLENLPDILIQRLYEKLGSVGISIKESYRNQPPEIAMLALEYGTAPTHHLQELLNESGVENGAKFSRFIRTGKLLEYVRQPSSLSIHFDISESPDSKWAQNFNSGFIGKPASENLNATGYVIEEIEPNVSIVLHGEDRFNYTVTRAAKSKIYPGLAARFHIETKTGNFPYDVQQFKSRVISDIRAASYTSAIRALAIAEFGSEYGTPVYLNVYITGGSPLWSEPPVDQAVLDRLLTLIGEIVLEETGGAGAKIAVLAPTENSAAEPPAKQQPPEITTKTEPTIAAKVLSVQILDANPMFLRDGKTMPQALKPTQLIAASTARVGTTADGVSQLIVRAELSENAPVTFEIEAVANDPKAPNGTLEPLLDGRTVTLAERHYAFALYTPPEQFDPPMDAAAPPNSPLLPPGVRLAGGLEVRELEVWASVEGNQENGLAPFVLARPPVVLVHGLFSDPIHTWVNTLPDGASMAALLERAGFLPFLVNYQDTNGRATVLGEKHDSFLFDAKDLPFSAFKDNYRVVWDSPKVDYEPIKYEYGFLEEEPILSELQKPQSTRIGGISQALTHYRDELNLAATQAVVVGHSMGGILARVWASKAYNESYERPENFGQGDIDRLLTLNTPHHGSELVELKDAFLKADVSGEDWLSWGRRQLANTALWWLFEPESGALRDLRPASPELKRIGATKLPVFAIATQFAEGELGAQKNDPLAIYQALYAFAGTVFFNNRPMLDAFVQNRFEAWQSAPEEQRKFTDWRGQAGLDLDQSGNLQRYKQIIGQAIDDNVYFWAARRDADFQGELRTSIRKTVVAQFGFSESSMGNDNELEMMSPLYIFSNTLIGADVSRAFDDSRESDTPETFNAILRNLLFHNDPNTDGAVRVESQLGDASESARETIKNVMHSYAPWDYRVQRRVLFLLRGESARFDPQGFPVAGRALPRYLPSSELSDARVHGAEAIAWSGMVPSHAQQYLQVADAQNVFVLVRPVNPASTGLLACDAAAKGMNVKGKSANWGPQVGLIPFDQRYSKIWRVVKDSDHRRADIVKYNKETVKSTTEDHPEMQGRHYAVIRPLQNVRTANGICDVLTDPKTDDAEAGVLFLCGDDFFKWQNAKKDGLDVFDPDTPLVAANVDGPSKSRLLANPMLVLADDTSNLEPRPYLTADYDLLAIGFRFEAAQCEGGNAPPPGGDVACLPAPTEGAANATLDPLRGFISPRQKDLVEDLNRAVRDNTGYAGGYVTHHGPETQYPKSPYVDYPILVFDPMGADVKGDGEAYLVRQGPPGFRDIHLKRLFAEKNRLGYNLWPNPTSSAWRWNERRAFDMARGYDPRDAADLLPYVEEAPRPDADAVERVALALSGNGEAAHCGPQSDADAVADKPLDEKVAEQSDKTEQPLILPPLPLQATLPDLKQAAPEGLDFVQRMFFLAAQRGQASAQLKVAEWYEFGYPLPKDEAAALGWYALAANQGDAEALYKLGSAYDFGNLGLPKDRAMSAQWLLFAAERGHGMAQLDLAWFYEHGDGVPQDDAKSLYWITRSAEQDFDLAQFYLGNLYATGTSPLAERDPVQAIKWYTLAADQGLASAEVALGLAYVEGKLVEQDFVTARKWLVRAAKAGTSRAQIALGDLNRWGQGGGVDFRQAEHWYTKAADQGDENGLFRLGKLYEQIEKDTFIGSEKSIFYLSEAAQAGHLEATYRLGERYSYGIGVETDAAEAVLFLTIAADKGHAQAQADLGRHYESGTGVTQSYEKAAALYESAAEKENAQAQSDLGGLYLNGLGVEHNIYKAASMFIRAADQNDPVALFNLGEIYQNGTAGLQDNVIALMYFDLALWQGFQDAAEPRDALKKQLTPEQLELARQRVRAWKVAHP